MLPEELCKKKILCTGRNFPINVFQCRAKFEPLESLANCINAKKGLLANLIEYLDLKSWSNMQKQRKGGFPVWIKPGLKH